MYYHTMPTVASHRRPGLATVFDTLRASHDMHEANWFAHKPDLISNLYDTNQRPKEQLKEVVSSTFFFCDWE